VTFARKTYLTANLRDALSQIGNRLAGEPTSHAVHRMQTEFGGGKTHTLLSAYHLFGNARAVAKTPIGRELAESIVGGKLPHATIAVLDGSDLTPDRDEDSNQSPARTLLGHLAYRLGGTTGYERVRADDEAVRPTSVSQLVDLLTCIPHNSAHLEPRFVL
jgi:predicted AAA+ superfamily ATPase